VTPGGTKCTGKKVANRFIVLESVQEATEDNGNSEPDSIEFTPVTRKIKKRGAKNVRVHNTDNENIRTVIEINEEDLEMPWTNMHALPQSAKQGGSHCPEQEPETSVSARVGQDRPKSGHYGPTDAAHGMVGETSLT